LTAKITENYEIAKCSHYFSNTSLEKQRRKSSMQDSEVTKCGILYGLLILQELEILRPNYHLCGDE
jgi:hypothetical protein